MAIIPVSHIDLLQPAKKALGMLALVTSKGEPQVTPTWFDFDGEFLILNTARGRVKDKIMRRRPMVALAVVDPENPFRYLQIRGHVVAETEEGGYEQICALSEKYTGSSAYPRYPGEVRVTYKVRPETVNTMG